MQTETSFAVKYGNFVDAEWDLYSIARYCVLMISKLYPFREHKGRFFETGWYSKQIYIAEVIKSVDIIPDFMYNVMKENDEYHE